MRLDGRINIGSSIGSLLIGILSALVFNTTASGQTNVVTARTNPVASRVESVGFTVSDLDKAIGFYTNVLSFEKISEVEVAGADYERLQGVFGLRMRVARLKLGNEILELTEYLAPQGRPIPVDSRSNDRWFQHIAIIVSDMEKAYARLRQFKVRHASTNPQTLPKSIPNAAGITAFYFKDFDGHVLEILHFPQDKGAAKWHQLSKTRRLFLGIDHTAIVVANTENSLKFYRDALGLRFAGESENFGEEQAHLNNVRDAHLQITGLRTVEDGIAVEFLEYVNPLDGRPFPADTRSNDIWHWQLTFLSSDIARFINVHQFPKSRFVSDSDEPVTFKQASLGFTKGIMLRDFDGHAVRLVSQ